MNANNYLPSGQPNFPNHDESSRLDTYAVPSATTPGSCYGDAVMRKKRRVDRACDACRRRKTKCDGPKMPQNVCTNCIQSRKNCTYMEESKPRGPSKAYITALEDKVEQMNALLKMLRPEMDFDAELGPPIARDSWKVNPSAHLPTKLHPDSVNKRRSSSRLVSSPAGNPTSTGAHHKVGQSKGKERDSQSGSEDSEYDDIVRGIGLMDIGSENQGTSLKPTRYSGKSSGFSLLQKAQTAKQEYMKEVNLAEGNSSKQNMSMTMRPKFWDVPFWELDWDGLNHDKTLIRQLKAALPPADLSRELINIWFQNVNMHYPLLHRPTFEQQWQTQLQYRDVWFAALCLSIFAVASRWSDDVRVLPEMPFNSTVPGDIDWHGAGRRYYDAALHIHHVRKTMVVQACLAEIQTHVAMAMYLRGTTEVSVTWLCISLGLRKAQDLGAHRKQAYCKPPDIVEELWRRAYWILVVLDRIVSCTLGRPCCVRTTDCDLNLPTEVDDEHWDMNGKTTPTQPLGKPALIVAFNHIITLTKSIELVMNSILAVATSKLRIGIPRGPKWKEEVVMRLNIDMSKWLDSVPPHLRWSPSMADRVFSDQAATLYTTYYLLQLMTYRPFTSYSLGMNEHQKELTSNFPFPASTICINAAKECARILNAQKQLGFSNITNLISSCFIPAMLLIDVWKKNKLRETRQSEVVKPQSLSILEAISILVKALESVAWRWDSAHTSLQKIKASLGSILEPTPRHLPEPVYPHIPIGFDGGTILNEPDNLQSVSSLPFILPDPIEIAAPIDSVADWIPMPQTSMYVSASYPPRNHHYLDGSSQPNWSHNDFAPSISNNQPLPNRPLTRTYSIDNLNLLSYPTAPVPVPPTDLTREVTSMWEPQALAMQTGRPPVHRTEYGGFVPKPTPAMNIPRPMHGQTRNEQYSDWDAEESHYGHRQSFEQNSMLGTIYPIPDGSVNY